MCGFFRVGMRSVYFCDMAQSMDYGIQPWMIAQAITKLPPVQGVQTLQALQTAILADVAAKLTFPCPFCAGSGRILDPNGNLVQDVNCGGWGATEQQLKVVKTITGTTDIPTVST